MCLYSGPEKEGVEFSLREVNTIAKYPNFALMSIDCKK